MARPTSSNYRYIVPDLFSLDLQFNLVPLHSAGLSGVGGALVHAGFLAAYNSVALKLLRIVRSQVTLNPSYPIVVTGHSLGGAIASLGAISIRSAHPQAHMKLFTFGGYLPDTTFQSVNDQLYRTTQDRKFCICGLR